MSDKLQLVMVGGSVRKQLEKAGGRIVHLDYQAGQRLKGITTWLRPVEKGEDDGIAWLAVNGDKVVEKDGKKMIDLMALSYEQLPPGWQKANDVTATFAVNTVCLYYVGCIGVLTKELRRDLARYIHMKWVVDQLSWAKEEIGKLPSFVADNQHKDFLDLKAAEQDKDQAIVDLICDEIDARLAAA